MSAVASDLVIRALTDDGSFRVLTARTTGLCAEAVKRQKVSGDTARHFADLLTGTVLVRETMAPQLRVQGIVRGAGGGCTLVGDSFPDGGTRGLVTKKRGQQGIVLGGDAVMQFMRTMPNGAIHRGVVSVPAEGGISAALMAYMQDSEQIVTVMSACTLFDAAGHVRSAGGFVVQLLPNALPETVAVMTERLAHDFMDITRFVDAEQFDPDALLEEICYLMPFSRVESRDVSFHCPCSHASILGGLATIGPEELQSLIDEGQLLDISCEYCGNEYQVAPEELRGLISAS